MTKELKVGQKVWYLPPYYRQSAKSELQEATITKVGRKHFELESKRFGKFDIENLRCVSDYNNNSRVYLSESDYYEEVERNINWDKIRRAISSTYICPFTNEQLKKILEIIS